MIALLSFQAIQNLMYKRLIVFSFALCLLPLLSFADEISVRVDNSQIVEGQSFHLIFTVMDENQNVRPDLTPLQQDFSILASSESVQMNIVNGASRTSKQFIVRLSAKKSGDLQIPPIQFGDQQSKALSIHVLSPDEAVAEGEPSLNFIEVNVNNESPYVQSEVIYSLWLFTTNYVTQGGITDPDIENASLIRLGQDQNYQERRGGQLYNVIERQYAIFPQQSGVLTIYGPTFSGRIQGGSLGIGNLFFNSGIQQLSLTAANINLDVQPIPAAFQGRQWLPAAQLLLSENWSGNGDSIYVGDPIVRQITIEGTGLLASQLSPLSSDQIQGVNSYFEQVSVENYVQDGFNVGKRVDQIVYIPSESGSLELPSLEIPWWNTQTNSAETARLPSRTIQVLAAAGGGVRQDDHTSSGEDVAPQPLTDLQGGINAGSLSDNNAITPRNDGIISDYRNLLLPWSVTALTFFVWLVTLLFWFRSARQQKKNKKQGVSSTQNKSQQYSERKNYDALKQACDNNDKYAAKKALLLWARYTWPRLSFYAIADVIAACSNDNLSQQLEQLNLALYGQASSNWQGQPLWESFTQFKVKEGKHAGKQAKKQLPPLYLNE